MKTLRAPFKALAISLSFLLSCLTFAGDPITLKSLSEGKPALMARSLGESSYAAVGTRRLAKAKVLWINWDLLRTWGIVIPPGGLSPEFEQQVLDAIAYAIPAGDEPVGTFVGETKLFYADRYGGLGMNGNLGSGRAASAGRIQIKGIGRTPMVGPKVTDIGHAHGGANIVESLHEAVWGEVLNRELPHGANRVVAVLDTGLQITADGSNLARGLAVREEPLRPAHFLSNPSAEGSEGAIDRVRTKNVLTRLASALPKSRSGAGESEFDRLRLGLNEFIDRVGEQYAAAYAKGVYHGATSPSNILVDSKLADYGTQTALSGYQKVQTILEEGEGPNGDTMTQKRELIKDTIEDMRRNLPKNLKGAVPSIEAAYARYDAAYEAQLRREMLKLAGVPSELLESLSATSEGKALADLLLEVAEAGNEQVIHPWKGENPGSYNLGQVNTRLAEIREPNLPKLQEALRGEMKAPALRNKLAATYLSFFERMSLEAKKAGISNEALHGYRIAAVKVRNQKMPSLYNINQGTEDPYYQKMWNLVEDVRKGGDPKVIQDFVDQRVSENARTFSEAGPLQVVTGEKFDRATRTITRTTYDARTGKYLEHSRGVVAAKAKMVEPRRGSSLAACVGAFFSE